LAIKKERAAQRLYTALAALADSDVMKSMFQALAQEEAKHELGIKTEVILQLRREQHLEQKGLRNNRGQGATDDLTSP